MGPVCPLMIFCSLSIIHHLIKKKLLDLFKHAFKKYYNKMRVHFILPVTIEKRFSLLQTIDDIYIGIVRTYVTPYRIFWMIFTSDLVISYMYTDKLLVFR